MDVGPTLLSEKALLWEMLQGFFPCSQTWLQEYCWFRPPMIWCLEFHSSHWLKSPPCGIPEGLFSSYQIADLQAAVDQLSLTPWVAWTSLAQPRLESYVWTGIWTAAYTSFRPVDPPGNLIGCFDESNNLGILRIVFRQAHFRATGLEAWLFCIFNLYPIHAQLSDLDVSSFTTQKNHVAILIVPGEIIRTVYSTRFKLRHERLPFSGQRIWYGLCFMVWAL